MTIFYSLFIISFSLLLFYAGLYFKSLNTRNANLDLLREEILNLDYKSRMLHNKLTDQLAILDSKLNSLHNNSGTLIENNYALYLLLIGFGVSIAFLIWWFSGTKNHTFEAADLLSDLNDNSRIRQEAILKSLFDNSCSQEKALNSVLNFSVDKFVSLRKAENTHLTAEFRRINSKMATLFSSQEASITSLVALVTNILPKSQHLECVNAIKKLVVTCKAGTSKDILFVKSQIIVVKDQLKQLQHDLLALNTKVESFDSVDITQALGMLKSLSVKIDQLSLLVEKTELAVVNSPDIDVPTKSSALNSSSIPDGILSSNDLFDELGIS